MDEFTAPAFVTQPAEIPGGPWLPLLTHGEAREAAALLRLLERLDGDVALEAGQLARALDRRARAAPGRSDRTE